MIIAGVCRTWVKNGDLYPGGTGCGIAKWSDINKTITLCKAGLYPGEKAGQNSSQPIEFIGKPPGYKGHIFPGYILGASSGPEC